ncbi:MAG: HEAT repeat domain-containing protein, partial [Planctomycetota bacterium]
RRVYTHRYLYIRQDAAVAMAMLGMKDKLTFDILTELLTDVEPEHSPYGRDEYFVRREAWLSLWTLFGMIPGASKPELFQRAPRMSTTRPARLFPWAQNRPGVNAEMVASLDPHSKDLEYMKRVQQQYRSLWAEIETRLAEEAKDAAQAPPPGGAKPPPGGTKPPPGGTKPPPGAPPKDGPADKDAADKGADPGDKQEPAGDKQGKSEKSKDKGPPGPPPPTESKPAPASAARGLVDGIYTNKKMIRGERRELEVLRDRPGTLEVLSEYLNKDDDNIDGKVRLVSILLRWKQAHIVRRAFSSGPLSARRAVTARLYYAEGYQKKARTVTLEWLKDPGAPARHLAIEVAGRIRLSEALPVVQGILEKPPQGEQETLDFEAALRALPQLAPRTAGETALRVARDKRYTPSVHRAALSVLRRSEQVPVNEVRDLLISYLLDPREDKHVRTTAAVDLKMQRYAGEKTWKALEEILLEQDVPLEQIVRQRSALTSLGAHMPLDRLKQLVTNRRVYTHRYLYIRQDAAVAMALLGMKDKVTFDILTGHLTHTEQKGSPYQRDAYLVRREAWISLWSLFHMMAEPPRPEMFQKPPRAPAARPKDLFPWAFKRPGVTRSMMKEIDPVAKDLKSMKRIQHRYRALWPEIDARLLKEQPLAGCGG